MKSNDIVKYSKDCVTLVALNLFESGLFEHMWTAEVVDKIQESYHMFQWFAKCGVAARAHEPLARAEELQAHFYMINTWLDYLKENPPDRVRYVKLAEDYSFLKEDDGDTMLVIAATTEIDPRFKPLQDIYKAYRLFDNKFILSKRSDAFANAESIAEGALVAVIDRMGVPMYTTLLLYLCQQQDGGLSPLFYKLRRKSVAGLNKSLYLPYFRAIYYLSQLELDSADLRYALRNRDVANVMYIRGEITTLMEND